MDRIALPYAEGNIALIGFPPDLPEEFGELINAEQDQDDLGLPAKDLTLYYRSTDGEMNLVAWVPSSRRRTLAKAGRSAMSVWETRANRSGASPQGAA